jgi:hypothetical protein
VRGNIGDSDPGARIVYDDVCDEMAAFDALPAEAQELLREAPIKLSAVMMADRITSHGVAVVCMIVRHQLAQLPSPYEASQGASDGRWRSLLPR